MKRRAEYLVVCAVCGAQMPLLSPRPQCVCGGLLEARPRPSKGARALRALFDERRRSGDPRVEGSGVWRFRELILPGRGAVITHPEGNTTLYRRDAISAWVGIDDLSLKHEGENPTGSFKDRGMTVATTQAVRAGATAVACASTGNTSASMAGLRCPGRAACPRLRSRGQGRGWQAGPGPGVWGDDAPGQRRLRHVPPPGSRDLRGLRRGAAQLHQPVEAGGSEDDRPGDAPAAPLESTRLDRSPRGRPGQHVCVWQGSPRGAGARPHLPRAPARLGPGPGGESLLQELSHRLQEALPRPRRDRGHRDPHRRTRPATTARSARSGRHAVW